MPSVLLGRDRPVQALHTYRIGKKTILLTLKAQYYKKKIFYLREVVSRYRDPQLHVGENFSYLLNLTPDI